MAWPSPGTQGDAALAQVEARESQDKVNPGLATATVWLTSLYQLNSATVSANIIHLAGLGT